MAWRVRYRLWIDYLAPGLSAMGGTTFNPASTGNPASATTGPTAGAAVLETPSSSAQTLMFTNTPGGQSVLGAGAAQPGGNSLTSGDITSVLTAMTTDLSAQMNAALGRINGFPSGGG